MSLTEIGEERNALLCITNKNTCCKLRSSIIREWYFPNGSQVRLIGDGANLYRNRGPSVVRLNRRNKATSPTGIFQCEIPSAIQLSNIIYIGIYHVGQGNFHLFAATILLITFHFDQ